MMSPDSLDLVNVPLHDPEFTSDPFPYFDLARQRHPWLARCEFGFVVHEYTAINDLLAMDDKMRMDMDAMVDLLDAKDTRWGRFQSESMQNRQGASHKRIRDAVNPWFTPRQANLRRALMQSAISDLLDEWMPKGAFDFEEFASHFPIRVMCRILGASTDVVPGLRPALEAFGQSANFDRSYVPKWEMAIDALESFARELVGERRRSGQLGAEPDLLDGLLKVRDDDGLSERELIDLVIFVFVAGYDTSKNLLTKIMYILLDYPEYYQRCAADLGFCKKVVDETMRYHGVVTTYRVMMADISYRDVALPRGTMVFFPLSLTGRDTRITPDANEFNPERVQEHRHMGFGRGPHICLGQFIARAQVEEGLHIIAQRITRPKLAGPIGWRPFVGAWGLHGLPISLA